MRAPRRGGVSIPMLVILVPVLFGLMGFAIDLGRMYLIRGELQQTAASMASAAAYQLMGTGASLGNATAAAAQSLDDTNHLANKYNFGSLPIGQTTGNLTSTVDAPSYFATVADALSGTGVQADGTTARHVRINLFADAPLIFWSLLPVGQARKTPIAATAVAGISAPLCTACGIEPFAIQAPDVNDGVNFGLGDPTLGTVYTFAYACSGNPQPPNLPGGPGVLSYAILNRYDAGNAVLTEDQQLYRIGAQGLLASTNPNPTGSPVPMACIGINDPSELIWVSASPNPCTLAPVPSVVNALCGLYSRMDNTNPPAACSSGVSGFSDLFATYQPDTDVLTGLNNFYTDYNGNGRRIITIPIVNVLGVPFTGTMTVLGFRQFLVELGQDGDPTTAINPTDRYGRFLAMYIGSPAPVRQGYVDDRFGMSCPAPVASGPGKVVLHQ